ncbi:L,D-transpeptidase [Methylobacterium radiodurans]|uniref:Murein L,D-transpeptidase n=1 Tax=Methylobacterium radiodurans TaxID=2202828 RepID=A0A2U8VY84_9HYPH|nr:L,D-transpeptidase [Methylobacterium radiodurans]AWN38739.1 murein L,D-transpeptidase [Methylobacterium radiodurans]
MQGFSMRAGLAALALAALSGTAEARKTQPKTPEPPPLTAEAINNAALPAEAETGKEAKAGSKGADRKAARRTERPDPLLVKVQVLLDRARFSPGAIDGRDGDNLQGAIAAYAAAQGLPATKAPTPALLDKLRTDSKPVVTEYTVSEDDAKTPFVERVPRELEKQADLDSLGYTNAREMLAERFHMSRDLLSALNPGKPFDKPGTVLLVAAVTPLESGRPNSKELPQEPKVERIEVDKTSRDVRALDKDGKLVAYYPASIGSAEKPAPSGETKVTRVAFDPTYTYNPKYAFKGVKARRKFTVKAGPNNPVGAVWIDLAIESYGIHGTPEPENVGKTESHGCIRLTNWDARDLGLHVAKGARVSFKDG